MKKDNNSGEDRGINVRKHKRSMEDWAVDCFAYGMAAFLMISIILPFMQVVTIRRKRDGLPFVSDEI